MGICENAFWLEECPISFSVDEQYAGHMASFAAA